MIQWQTEIPLIKATAEAYTVDWKFIAAIRNTENGATGRDFGVLSVPAPTYNSQLQVACASVSHRLNFYVKESGKNQVPPYSPDFIQYFARVWAPPSANNDPDDLNANWLSNCTTFYAKLNTGWIPA